MIVGIGIDLVEIERMRLLLARKGERALQRMFTERERTYAHTHPEPERQLAARAAAKEATYKALSGNDLARGIGWRDVEVQSRDDGAPHLKLYGRALQRFEELHATSIHVSLTHSATTAIAVVVVER